MKTNLADIRQEYTKSGLRENELPGDPLSLFSRWLQEAIDAEADEPTAVIVGTVSPEGKPSTRTVLLKGLHDGKFVFYTNYESRKGRQLAQNPYISLSFVWHALERQKGRQPKSIRKNRMNISVYVLIKAESAHESLRKASPSKAGCS